MTEPVERIVTDVSNWEGVETGAHRYGAPRSVSAREKWDTFTSGGFSISPLRAGCGTAGRQIEPNHTTYTPNRDGRPSASKAATTSLVRSGCFVSRICVTRGRCRRPRRVGKRSRTSTWIRNSPNSTRATSCGRFSSPDVRPSRSPPRRRRLSTWFRRWCPTHLPTRCRSTPRTPRHGRSGSRRTALRPRLR